MEVSLFPVVFLDSDGSTAGVGQTENYSNQVPHVSLHLAVRPYSDGRSL
jgi:hypothetical protein